MEKETHLYGNIRTTSAHVIQTRRLPWYTSHKTSRPSFWNFSPSNTGPKYFSLYCLLQWDLKTPSAFWKSSTVRSVLKQTNYLKAIAFSCLKKIKCRAVSVIILQRAIKREFNLPTALKFTHQQFLIEQALKVKARGRDRKVNLLTY